MPDDIVHLLEFPLSPALKEHLGHYPADDFSWQLDELEHALEAHLLEKGITPAPYMPAMAADIDRWTGRPYPIRPEIKRSPDGSDREIAVRPWILTAGLKAQFVRVGALTQEQRSRLLIEAMENYLIDEVVS